MDQRCNCDIIQGGELTRSRKLNNDVEIITVWQVGEVFPEGITRHQFFSVSIPMIKPQAIEIIVEFLPRHVHRKLPRNGVININNGS